MSDSENEDCTCVRRLEDTFDGMCITDSEKRCLKRKREKEIYLTTLTKLLQVHR